MTAANGTAPAPQVDARKLASLRKTSLAAAKKALTALEACVTADRATLENGGVPPGRGLHQLADKYLALRDTLDLADQFLTPEALEALAEEDTPEPGTVTVNRDSLALASELIRDSGLLPGPVGEDTPLGQLFRAAGTSYVQLAEMASVPARGDGIPTGPLPLDGSWYDGDGDGADSEPDPGWPPVHADEM